MTTRREVLIAFGAGVISWRVASAAQQPARMPRIGLLSSFSPSTNTLWDEAFRQGLRELGWVEGKNVGLEYRYAGGKSDRLPDLAADLVRLNVDVIVATATNDCLAAQKATRTIPIVMVAPGDPVASGLVESLARPGGNLTGLSQLAPDLAGKRLELLREILPKLSGVAVLWNPQGAASMLGWKEIQAPARQLGIQLHSLEVRGSEDLDKAFEQPLKTGVMSLVILPDPALTTNLRRVADFAIRNRLPSMFHIPEFVEAGGLVAYGVNRSELFRRAATFVDKILKGARPGDLPVEQPSKFELVLNLKTAKTIGISIPQSVLLRANKVIE